MPTPPTPALTPDPSRPIIHVDGLVKEFSRPDVKPGRFAGLRGLVTRKRRITRAVDGVSFDVQAGELVGYLGPNGAGKSTTNKMLTGILVPTAGVLQVNGQVPWRDRQANARMIGVVFGQRSQLWYELPLRDSFEMIRDLYDIAPVDYTRRMGEFTELLDLADFIDTPVRSLSLGQRMRGDLVAAMLHVPPLLYLDEPTVGLDVVARSRIRQFVAETNARLKTTVILTTHDMDDVERLCRRIVIIDSGRILYDGDLTSLKTQWAPYRELVVTLAEDAVLDQSEVAPARVHSRDGQLVTLRFDPTELSTPALISRVNAAAVIDDLTVNDPDLEDVITQIYAGIVR